MNVASILTPDRTRHRLHAGSKKRALEEIAGVLAPTMSGVTREQLFECLIGREKIGTTAIGHGIAIPHCRLDACPGIIGGLFRLEEPVDFGAFDDEAVQLLFVLIVPASEVNDHLQTLAMLARSFESDAWRSRLLSAPSDAALFEAATSEVPSADTKQASV